MMPGRDTIQVLRRQTAPADPETTHTTIEGPPNQPEEQPHHAEP
jgi:hypothetical protein